MLGRIWSGQCFILGKTRRASDDVDMDEVGVALLVAARELIVVGALYEMSSGIVDSFAVAVPSTETSVCARDRTNSRLSSAFAGRIDTTAVTYATLCHVVEYIAPVPAVCAATVPVNECVWNCSVTDCDCVPNTMPFRCTWVSSRYSASLRQRRMLIGSFVVRTKLLDFLKHFPFTVKENP